MSSTQMDLSPIVINRKQDIASWPEGDTDQLTARDKNRYQKRRAALIDYFQSDLEVAEISARHRLSAVDVLETMARRCCVLHEDGRPWGFRALVPGVRVIEASSVTDSARDQAGDESDVREAVDPVGAVEIEVTSELVQNEVEVETTLEEDTAEHKAVRLKNNMVLPQTPIPTSAQEQAALASIEAAAEDTEIVAPATEQGDEAVPSEPVETLSTEEVAQEDFPTVVNPMQETGVEIEEEVAQEDFPTVTSGEEEVETEEEVAQEDFPTTVMVVEEETEEEVAQEEFPTITSVGEEAEVEEEEVAQEDFPTAVMVVEEVEEEEVAQEEFPGAVSVGEEVEEEEVAQEEFPTAVMVVEEAELVEEEEEQGNEPTGKLSDPRADEEPVEEEKEPLAVELLQTTKLETIQSDEREDEEEKQEQEPEAEVEVAAGSASKEEAAETEVAEQDTVEVARVIAEERLNRVASTETIKVPAAMLEALEKADQDLQARTETLTEPAGVPQTPDAGAEKRPVASPPALVAAEETQVSEGADDVTAVPTRTLEAQRRDSRQVSQAPAWKAATQALVEDSRYRITGSQTAIKHAVLRRWGKQGRQQKYRRWVRIISAAIIVSLLVILLIPLGVGLVGYNAYTNIKSVATDGVNNLLAIQSILPKDKNDLVSALNVQKLAEGKAHLQKAQDDFLQLQDIVSRPDIQSLLQQFAPQYSKQLDMARRLVGVALDVTRMGQELIGVGQTAAGILHGGSSLLASSNTPLISADQINAIQAALVHAEYYIGDIQAQMSQVDLAQVPFGNAAQKEKLGNYLKQIPQALDTINQVQTLIGPVAWMLGVGTARHFLVQTLDRGELRPSGGFEGQYGILTLQDGRLAPFSLSDIAKLDYGGNGAELGATPPSQYNWMNFGSFGVRDANLSADFPTTAKIVMNYFQLEGGGPVDGDIQITPVVIEQFLQITGPIKVAEYNDTVTAQNLETKLHAYQQDPRLIAVQQDKTGQDTHQTRKAFTNLLGKLIMDRAKHLPFSQLMDFGKQLFKDLKSRDLQVYLNNPVAQQWLQQNQNDGAMPRFINGMDGFMVVQANISISKAAQYVKSTFNDQVTLNADGSANHDLTISLNYQQKGPVYGYDSYADYMRIYAPKGAQLTYAYGFNTGQTLCTPNKPVVKPPTGTGKGGTGKGTGSGSGSSGSSGGSYTDAGVPITGCSQYYNSFPDETNRYCADGNYRLGYNGMQAKAWAVQALGAPTQTHSDLPGYSMWGGMTLTPKNCVSKIELRWTVPHIVQKTAGQSPYQITVGHQAGWPDIAQVSVDASALKGVKSQNFNQTITVDTTFSLAPLPGGSPTQQKPGSTPTPAVTPTATPKKQ